MRGDSICNLSRQPLLELGAVGVIAHQIVEFRKSNQMMRRNEGNGHGSYDGDQVMFADADEGNIVDSHLFVVGCRFKIVVDEGSCCRIEAIEQSIDIERSDAARCFSQEGILHIDTQQLQDSMHMVGDFLFTGHCFR